MGIKCHTWAVEVQTPTVCLRGLQSLNPGFGGNVRRCLVWHPLLQHSERYHSKPELYQKTNLLLFSRTSCTEILSLTYSLNPVFIHSFLPYFFLPSIDLRDIDRIIIFFFSPRDRETPPMSESSEVQRKKVILSELQPVTAHRPGLLTPSPMTPMLPHTFWHHTPILSEVKLLVIALGNDNLIKSELAVVCVPFQ